MGDIYKVVVTIGIYITDSISKNDSSTESIVTMFFEEYITSKYSNFLILNENYLSTFTNYSNQLSSAYKKTLGYPIYNIE